VLLGRVYAAKAGELPFTIRVFAESNRDDAKRWLEQPE
jgi:hypothetical protein